MINLKNKLKKLDVKISDLFIKKEKLINTIQNKCKHLIKYRKSTGYNARDGYGGLEWIDTGWKCKSCNYEGTNLE